MEQDAVFVIWCDKSIGVKDLVRVDAPLLQMLMELSNPVGTLVHVG